MGGYVILDQTHDPLTPKLNRVMLSTIGFACIILSFVACWIFMRMKLPGYLQHSVCGGITVIVWESSVSWFWETTTSVCDTNIHQCGTMYKVFLYMTLFGHFHVA